MYWKTEPGKDNRGSRPRAVLLADGSREHVAERLARIVDRPEVVFSPEDRWQPRGKPDVREAQLDKQLKDGAVLLPGAMRRRMRDWWLVDHRSGRARTATWDVASTCTISGKKGLLLVEAKAHSEELKKDDRCWAKRVNRTRIDRAIEEANVGLRELTGGPWELSTRHHYQLSNRFAWSWKLAMMGVPVVLLYLGFLNACEMQTDGDTFQSESDWRDTLWAYCRGVVDESCWDKVLDVSGVPLMPLIGAIEQPLDP